MKKRLVSFLLALTLAVTEATDGSLPSVVFASEISAETVSEAEENENEDEEPVEVEAAEEPAEQEVSQEDIERFNDMSPDNLKPIEAVKIDCDSLTEAVFGTENDEQIELNGSGIENLEKYDPRVENPDLVTPTKNQNPYGTCWTFGCMGMIETNLIKRGFCDNTIDLSELHLAYFAYNTGIDTVGASGNDKQKDNDYLDEGGNLSISATTLLNWHGVASEEAYPYENAGEGKIAASEGQNDIYTVSDVYYIPLSVGTAEEGIDALKAMISEYGAVTIAYFHDDAYVSYGEDYTAYNSGDNYSYSNHEVTLVGWDDNFSKENFELEPENDGAWLVKNSWGEGWGNDGGYFYVSYEDQSFGDEAGVFVANDKETYDNNYFHNNVSDIWSTSEIREKAAEVFTIKNEKEELEGTTVGFANDNVNYKVDVYKLNVSDTSEISDPTDGELLISQTGRTTLPGYYTIDFDTPVKVDKDDIVSLVFSTTDGSDLEIYTTYSGVFKEGESFLYTEGWEDQEGWEDTAEYQSQEGNRINLLTNTVEDADDICTVIFKDESGKVLKNGTVKAGAYAVALENPAGYKYTYDYDFSKPVKENITVTVTKNPIEYRIYYSLNGGTNSELNPTTYTIESGDIVLQPASKEDSTFKGWYLDKECTIQIESISAEDIKNIRVYARFCGENGLDIYPYSDGINEGQDIEICADSGDIYYTLDGTTPTINSIKYSGPFTVDKDTTVKVINVVDGKVSKVWEHSYKFYKINAVIGYSELTLVPGQKVSLTVEEEATDASSAHWSSYDESVVKVYKHGNQSKLVAVGEGNATICYGYEDHDENYVGIEVDVTVEATNEFKIWPDSDDEAEIFEGEPVVISAPEKAEVYYTLDGSEPTTESTKYEEAFTVSSSVEVKAIYVLDGVTSKPISQELKFVLIKPMLSTYELNIEVGEVAKVDILGMPEGYTGNSIGYDSLKINVDYVYRDRYDPSALKISSSAPGDGTIYFSSFDEETDEMSEDSVIEVHVSPLSVPAFSLRTVDGSCAEYDEDTEINVVLPEDYPDVSIYYTTDGSEPTEKSVEYSGAIKLEKSCTVKAILVKDGEILDKISQEYKFYRNTPVLSDEKINLNLGETKQIEVLEHVTDSSNSEEIYWGYDDDSVAAVDNGLITATGVGTSTIYYWEFDHNGNWNYASVSVTVDVESDELKITPCSEDGSVIDFEEIEKVNYDENKITIIHPKKSTVYYTLDGSEPTTSSKKYTKPFTLEEDAKLRAISVIDGEIVAKAAQDYKFIRMRPKLSTEKLVLNPGESATIDVLEGPTNSTNPGVTEWDSEILELNDDEEWVSIKDIAFVEDGKVTAVKEGTTYVYCFQYDRDGDDLCSSVEVTVKASADDYLKIYPETADDKIYNDSIDVYIGAPKNADVYYTLDGNEPTTESLKYENYFTVSESTVVKAISVIDGEVVASAENTFKFSQISFGFDETDLTIGLNETKKISYFEVSSNEGALDGSTIFWKSSDEKIAKVSSEGEIRAVGVGNAVITAVLTDKYGVEYEASTNIDVKNVDKDGNFFSQDENRVNEEKGITITGTSSFTYTGSNITVPNLKVYDNGYPLVLNKDYKVGYKSNKVVGTATAVVTLMGNYSGKKEFNFSIEKADISEAIITGSTFSYANRKLTNKFEVRVGNRKLTLNKDYKITSGKAGDLEFVIEGVGNYSGSKTVSVTVLDKNEKLINIGNAKVTLSETEFEYDGSAIEPAIVKVMVGKQELSNSDYTVIGYKSNTNVGTGYVILAGCGKYSGTRTISFKISKKLISQEDFKISTVENYLSGGVRPTMVTSLVENVDYKVSLKNANKLGNATVTITGCGNYKGSFKANYEILAKNLDACSIVRTGKNSVFVFDENGVKLSSGCYKYSFDKTSLIGTVKGKGNYTGEKTVKFDVIAKGAVNLANVSVKVNGNLKYTGYAITEDDIKNVIAVKYGKKILEAEDQYRITVLNSTPVKGYINAYLEATGSSSNGTVYYGGKTVKIKVVSN